MLTVLCCRPKPWVLSSLSLFPNASSAHHHHLHRHHSSPSHLPLLPRYSRRRFHHSLACQFSSSSSTPGGAASIWHALLPSAAAAAAAAAAAGDRNSTKRMGMKLPEWKGEGSWNAAWDTRPARWLHRPDSAWLLFGVCACLAPLEWPDSNHDSSAAAGDKIDCGDDSVGAGLAEIDAWRPPEYKVTGVLADGRCLFRAIVHGVCLRGGQEAPDDDRQRELADELRAQVVDELLKRRQETEWFIEGDFDVYVKEIQQPYVWGGEPELLMASHVLKTCISVFMGGRNSGGLMNIANYGEEYRKENERPINLLFHGYGHYELLENLPDGVTKQASA